MREILALEQARKNLAVRERARESFMVFAKHVYEGFIEGSHHTDHYQHAPKTY
jgi:hypothetical protein